MEISAMINELKAEQVSLEKMIRTLNDRHEAIKMSIESLELLASTRHVVVDIVPGDIATTSVASAPCDDVPVASREKRPGHPKRLVQKDPRGVVIREYRSVNAAAKAFGWTYNAMVKYLETTSKDRQIAIRGSYLTYAA